MFSDLTKKWRELKKGRAGHRFRDRADRVKHEQANRSWWRRVISPVIALVLIAIGVILCFIPGPGIPFLVIGAALLAEHSRVAARGLDGAEIVGRRWFRRVRSWWNRAGYLGKAALVLALLMVVAGAGFGGYCVLFRD